MPERSESVQNIARVGLIARGTVYLLVGLLALMVVIYGPGAGGRMSDSRGALRELVRQPFGYFVVSLMALGLVCYAVWRVLTGLFDWDAYGRRWSGWFVRVTQIFGGLVHLGLGAYALNLMFLFTRTNNRASEQRLVRWLFELPFGDWIVGAVGVGIVVFGVAQFVIAWREAFRHYMTIPDDHARVVIPICKYGLMARGIVFSIIGWFFTRAAFTHTATEAGGFREAWRALRAQPMGDAWVTFVALGFVAYGLFSVLEARYRT